jgi:hypothetical protein
LHVKLGNEAAIQFYLKHNFTLEEEIKKYYTIQGRSYNSLRFGKNLVPENGGKPWQRLWRWACGITPENNETLKKKLAANV